jgi:fatty acid desaturase
VPSLPSLTEQLSGWSKKIHVTYQDLRRQVQAAGLLDRNGWSSFGLALVVLGFGVASLVILIIAPGAWRFGAVPFLAMFWIQVGFFGHDAGHNGVFPTTEHNRRLGLICLPLVLGMAFRPWVIKHNLHHAETNVLESDPDIQHPLLAYTMEAARERRGALRWLVRYQAYTYPVLALFTTVGFRIDAWRYALGGTALVQRSDKYDHERRVELGLLAANVLLWLGVPSIVFGAGLWVPTFIAAQMLFGFNMAFVFAPNHKGMPMFSEATRLTFLEQQVLTSRNVYGGRFVDFMYGGLNYQVEHHLFPTMSRRRFAACRDIVKRFCSNAGLAYTETSVGESCRLIFTSLDEIGRSVTHDGAIAEVVVS